MKLTTLMPGAEVQNAKLKEILVKTNYYLNDGDWDLRRIGRILPVAFMTDHFKGH